jgi:hypothetical protein
MPETKPKRRWLRFSLRTLFVGLGIFCVWLSFKVNAVRKQKEAIDAFGKSDGQFSFDYQYKANDPNLLMPEDAVPPAPAWLRRFLGDDYFRTPVCPEIGYSGQEGHIDIGKGLLGQLKNLSSLKRLMLLNPVVRDAASLRGHPFSDDDLQFFTALHELRCLTIQGANVHGDGIAYIEHLKNLGIVELGNTPLDDAGVDKLSNVRSLFALDLSGTSITNKSLESIQRLTDLEDLNLSGNNISDDGLPYLGRLTKLQLLHLKKTKVTAEGIRELQKSLPKCRITGP